MLLNEALGLSLRQSEVDYVIPNLHEDLNLYVDPFLFYKSGNPEYHAVHATIREFFDIAVQKVNAGELHIAKRMLDFPEVQETMIGLTLGSHRGRGLGKTRTDTAQSRWGRTRGDEIYKEIVSNPQILEFGIQHLAQMQLLINNVGFDMISDMCTNIVKAFFINYTQRQCLMTGIPLEKGISLYHVFDWDDLLWDDMHTDLPVNPLTGNAMLLVPKTVVRRFSEIDYKDFWQTTYRYILRDVEIQRSLQSIGRAPKITWKEIKQKYDFCKSTVVNVLHDDPDLMISYLKTKEKQARDPLPFDMNTVEGADRLLTPADDFKAELLQIIPGNRDAKKYECLMLRILNKLFSPPLTDPKSQVTTYDGREIIDITFYNAADSGFWLDIKRFHGNKVCVFELKNMEDLGNEEFFQIAARLDDIKGLFGVLISRKRDNLDIQRAYRRLHNERKVILVLTDEDILELLHMLDIGINPTTYIYRLYRKFIEEA